MTQNTDQNPTPIFITLIRYGLAALLALGVLYMSLYSVLGAASTNTLIGSAFSGKYILWGMIIAVITGAGYWGYKEGWISDKGHNGLLIKLCIVMVLSNLCLVLTLQVFDPNAAANAKMVKIRQDLTNLNQVKDDIKKARSFDAIAERIEDIISDHPSSNAAVALITPLGSYAGVNRLDILMATETYKRRLAERLCDDSDAFQKRYAEECGYINKKQSALNGDGLNDAFKILGMDTNFEGSESFTRSQELEDKVQDLINSDSRKWPTN